MPRNPSSPRRTLGGVLVILVICAIIAVAVAGLRPSGAKAADDPVRCRLSVPAQPLSARGLATPYVLSGEGCSETDRGHSAFVQATVVDTQTGQVANYTPLVITKGTHPAIRPTVPTLPKHRVVGIWFGFNGDDLHLRGTEQDLRAARCVNGAAGGLFGQYAYCNAPAFFAAANAAIRSGRLVVPALGRGTDGQPCPTTRDFGIVDQDQSDNVTSAYFAVGHRTAQATVANAKRLPDGVVLTNASDNGLVDNKIDPLIGCTPWMATDLANVGQKSNSLALDELQAAALQPAPAALVPLNDPMVLDGEGNWSPTKTDAYRAGVDMPSTRSDPGQSPAAYCRTMTQHGWDRIQLDRSVFLQAPSPDASASNLYTFLGARLAGSYDNLGCAQLLKKSNPFRVTLHDGVAVDVAKLEHLPVPTESSASSSMTPLPAAKAPVTRTRSTPAPAGSTPTPTPTPTPTADVGSRRIDPGPGRVAVDTDADADSHPGPLTPAERVASPGAWPVPAVGIRPPCRPGRGVSRYARDVPLRPGPACGPRRSRRR